MRLFAILVLAGFLALVLLPGTGASAGMAHGPDCAHCPDDMAGHDPGHGPGLSDCAEACLAGVAAHPPLPQTGILPAFGALRLAPPEPVAARAVTVPIDLPPPRA